MRRGPDLSATSTEALWAEFGGRLRAFFRSRVRAREDAEDLLHETFARIHATVEALRGLDAVPAWLWRVARNVLIDWYRARRPSAPLPPDLAADAGTPEELNRIVASWLGDFLATLPHAYRTAIEESDLGPSTQRALAKRLGLSLSAVKSRVRRGRRMLMRRLLDCCDIDLDARGNVIGYRRRRDA